MAGSDTSNGAASWVTEQSPRASWSRIARRVGSASAENVADKAAEDLTIWLNIEEVAIGCQEEHTCVFQGKDTAMKITILGAGHVGDILGKKFAAAGHEVQSESSPSTRRTS